LNNENKLLPAIGIYAVELMMTNEKHFGLMSIGKRPTFYNEGQLTTEIYIYDFDRDIYNENVTVKVIERIRGEEKYSSPEELVAQMKKDKEAGVEIMSRLQMEF
jgi:riboflavin kinase/FMN adenylyltransferase